ncbi:HPr-rel-A system PqqD family peptide chaperone [Candidatus Methylocalor cossyra]|uniref:HPr-rel-A system PqqD family peptide chaperone n=1 Tax=Candidatus Methylocalor cossyra TaxID=3108543 RepID=UPI0032B1E453
MLWESFGEDAVVYNRRSGETHFLNCTAAETLRILQDRAATLAEVVAEIGGRFGLEPQAGLAEQVGRAIEEFERAGLICWSAP